MFFTRRGDDGYTDLLGGGRVSKEDARVAALGDVDEATAAIGVSRATATEADTRRALLHVQKDLYLLMADLATVAGKQAGQPRLDASRITAIEAIIADFDARITIPKEFVASGDSLPGAYLDVARTVVRRAERSLTRLFHAEAGVPATTVSYMNRLSSLLFGLARYEDQAAGARSTITKTIEE